MPHVLSSRALDILFAIELNGLAVPRAETVNQSLSAGGSTQTITRNANTIAKEFGIDRPVLIPVLMEVFNDPLLDKIEVRYDFIGRFAPLTLTYDFPFAEQALLAFFLPVKQFSIKITPTAVSSSDTTVVMVYDLMSESTAKLFADLGQTTIKELTEAHQDVQQEDVTARIKKRIIEARGGGGLTRREF